MTRYIFIFIAISSLLVSCNTNTSKENANTNSTQADLKLPQAKVAEKADLSALLSHFKTNTKFPVIIDSTYISNSSKKDSLGTREVKMLTKKWFKDDLVSDSGGMKDFYVVDSVKANDSYQQWLDSLKDYAMQPEVENAYGLQKITLADSTTLLVWSLSYSNEADPSYSNTNIYFTMVYKGSISETFLLGYNSVSADPPNADKTTLVGTLTKDGKLLLEKNDAAWDVDTTSAPGVSYSQYTYQISKGSIAGK